MYRTQKSATCCYCGNKTVLSLSEGARHELKCTSCGAPMSRLKRLHKDHVEDRYTVGSYKKKPAKKERDKPKKSKKRKKKKTLAYRLFDVAEDIIDFLD